MKITKVTFYDINNTGAGNFLSKCSVVLDNVFMLEDIKIFDGRKGRYLIMPPKAGLDISKESDTNREREDVFHPVDKAYFGYMSEIVLNGFSVYENKGYTTFIP